MTRKEEEGKEGRGSGEGDSDKRCELRLGGEKQKGKVGEMLEKEGRTRGGG